MAMDFGIGQQGAEQQQGASAGQEAAGYIGRKLKQQVQKRVKEGAQKVVTQVLSGINPVLGLATKQGRRRAIILAIVVLGIIAFVFFVIVTWLFGGSVAEQQGQDQQAGSAPANPLTISKIGPSTWPSGNFDYTITVGFPNSLQDIIVTDTLDKRVRPISSTWKKYTVGTDSVGNPTVTWKLSDNTTLTPSGGLYTGPITETFTLTVQPLVNVAPDIANTGATAVTVGAVGTNASASTAYVAPTNDTCSGKYTQDIANNPLKANFGDPLCELTSATYKDKIYALILQNEQAVNASNATNFTQIWFSTIIPQESSYNPNVWITAIDPQGAWGLFQMGSSTPPGAAPPAKGLNGQYDRGDVNWETQVSNAVTYNKGLGCTFWYWQSYQATQPTLAPGASPVKHC